MAATRLRAVARMLAIGLGALGLGAACDSGGDGNPRIDILGTERKRYSQFDEELIIRDFFQDRRGGIFVDVGSGPAIRGSTTFYLEKHLDWSGIGIDALPQYEKSYARQRPRTRFRNYIVTDHSGGIEKFYRVGAAPGLSSTIPDRVFQGKKLNAETIEIPTTTLDDLLENEGVEKIDFLSIDIEGGAPKALAGFNIERFAPDLVCIESAGPVEGYVESLRAYFEAHGYERIERYLAYDEVNWYFRRAP